MIIFEKETDSHWQLTKNGEWIGDIAKSVNEINYLPSAAYMELSIEDLKEIIKYMEGVK